MKNEILKTSIAIIAVVLIGWVVSVNLNKSSKLVCPDGYRYWEMTDSCVPTPEMNVKGMIEHNSVASSTTATYTDAFGFSFSYPNTWVITKKDNVVTVKTTASVPLTIKEISGIFADDSTGKWGDYKVHFDATKSQWIVTQYSDRGDAAYDTPITPLETTAGGKPIFSGGIHGHGWGAYSYIIALSPSKFLIINGSEEDSPFDPSTNKLLSFVRGITN